MAMGKYSRADGRKSSSYCSTLTVVVLVGAALVAAWMLMSSSVVPVPNSELSSKEPKAEMKSKIMEKITKQYEDSSGDLPEETEKESKDSQEENKDESKSEESESNSNSEETNSEEKDSNANEQMETEEGSSETKSSTEGEAKEEEKAEENQEKAEENQEKAEENQEKSEENQEESVSEEKKEEESVSEEKKEEESVSEEKKEEEAVNVGFPAGAQSEILNETTTQSGAWSTQAAESESEKESQTTPKIKSNRYKWKLCNVTAGPDYIPCLDNLLAISKLPHRNHYEHRERHCPDEGVTCLVPLPEGYRQPVKWPRSRDQIWYYNVPHTKLADVKGHQNWVKVDGEHLIFPGGGTQFKNGALHYIDFIQKSLPDIAWGKRSRVILDVGCGVASFGGFLFERDVLAMSLAPKDEHEAQVQFALERGIPAISAVMGTKRLPFPSKVYDIVHCARCRVPWHIEGGKLLLELNRVLRPGGYFVWSATPVYQNLPEDVGIWKAMSALTKQMCWELVTVKNDKLNQVGAAIFRKPTSNECYENRQKNEPPLCEESDDPDAVWNVELQACMHKVPEDASERGKQWPKQWPQRVEKAPYWLKSSQVGVYGKSAPEDFNSDYEHWKRVVSSSYLNGMGIDWSSVRNVMDMRAVYGGFAAALKGLKLWVMNVVPINSPDTLPIIFERGLFGIYHDWCESFSTYPRSYDLLHADHLLSDLKNRCKLEAVITEVDRMLRPEGKFIVRDNSDTISEVEDLAKSLKWKIKFTYSKDNAGIIYVEKTMWRPKEAETIAFAIA